MEPVYRLEVAGEDWTSSTNGIEYDNSDSGAATLTFVTRESTYRLENAPVTLRIGYKTARGSDLFPYFRGTLKRPRYDPGTIATTCTALGAFGEMATQFYGKQAVYEDTNLTKALMDTCKRGFKDRGRIEVIGGDDAEIKKQAFAEEVSLLEGAQALCEPHDFVGFDRPGADARRVFMKHPQPGQGKRAVARLTPRDYPLGGMQVEDSYEVSYAKVVVFRREDEEGSYEVREEAEVQSAGRFPAPKNRIYYIPEYKGNARGARRTAKRWARKLSRGLVKITIDGFKIDPEIQRYSQLVAVREVERGGGVWREEYEVVADESCGFTVGEWAMSVAGAGVLVKETRVENIERVVVRGAAA